MSNQNDHLAPMMATTLEELLAIADELQRRHGCDLETAIQREMFQLFRVAAAAATAANQPSEASASELLYKFVVILMADGVQIGMSVENATAAVNEAVRVLLSSPRVQAERAANPPDNTLQA